MSHPISRVVSFERVCTYELRLRFDNGLVIRIHFDPVLGGELLGPPCGPPVFAEVKLNPEVHTLAWPTDADFDPATMHEWLEHESVLKAVALRMAFAPRNCLSRLAVGGLLAGFQVGQRG